MVSGVKKKIFKSNATKPVCLNNVYRDKKESRKPKTEGSIIKDVRNLLKLKKMRQSIIE